MNVHTHENTKTKQDLELWEGQFNWIPPPQHYICLLQKNGKLNFILSYTATLLEQDGAGQL